MDGCIFFVGLMIGAWWLHKTLFSFSHQVTDKLLRWLGRSVMNFGWTMPKKHFGVGLTLWLWGVAAAVATTITGLLVLGQVGPWVVLPVILAWVLVIAGWRFLKWRAHRRYTPRPMPRRVRPRRR